MTTATSNNNNHHYDDALDDVHTRFILNLPDSELLINDRLFFQLEQAWWYYEDWICDIHPEYNLIRYTNLRSFAKMMFDYSPILPNVSTSQFNTMWYEFSNYRKSISNYGCILLTHDLQYMALCTIYNSKTFTFPSGKINHGENGANAAARETYEETGFDPSCQYGLTSIWKDTDPTKITWPITLSDDDMIVHQEEDNHNNNTNTTAINNNSNSSSNSTTTPSSGTGKRRTCYVVVGVPKDFPFAPVCRKEVDDISWYPVNGQAPKPSFGVIPFLPKLKRYIRNYKQQQRLLQSNQSRSRSSRANSPMNNTILSTTTATAVVTRNTTNTTPQNINNNNNNNEINSNSNSNKKKGITPKKNRSRTNSPMNSNSGKSTNTTSRGRNRKNNNNSRGRDVIIYNNNHDNLIQTGLANVGDITGWSEEDMFLVNEKLTGTKINYDGNPHIFAEKGFHNGIDPHSYRIVGGTLLNQQKVQTQETEQSNNVSSSDTPTTTNTFLEDLLKRTTYHRTSDNTNNINAVTTIPDNHSGDGSEVVPPLKHQQQPYTNKKHHHVDNDDDNDNDQDVSQSSLQPFFSNDGSTPWGEIIQEVIQGESQQQKLLQQQAAASLLKGEDDYVVISSPPQPPPGMMVDYTKEVVKKTATDNKKGRNRKDSVGSQSSGGNTTKQQNITTKKKNNNNKNNNKNNKDQQSKAMQNHQNNNVDDDNNNKNNHHNSNYHHESWHQDGKPFLTDTEITKRTTTNDIDKNMMSKNSQTGQLSNEVTLDIGKYSKQQQQKQIILQRRREQHEKDLVYIQEWVANLPKPKANTFFGEAFRLDADEIIRVAQESTSMRITGSRS